jgi:cytochrome P450
VVPVPDWFPSPTNLRFRRTLKQLNAIIYRMIAQRRSQPQERGDLLSILLHARDENDGAGMSDEQLRDEAMTIFLAGHETTANALSWTWYLLTQNPAEENKLLDELTAVLNGRPPTVADLSQLVFTERVLMESMRLYPPAYGFGRIALADCNIGGFRVPRGTNIILCPWVSHRDGRWFDEPLAFRPERWSNELAKRLPRYAYFPFGGGPRICIGNSFAMMEATLILATIAQRYHFRLRPDPPVVPHAYVTLRPGHGIPVTLAKR